jgi:hypothetical protein
MARVTCDMFLTLRIRRRISRVLGKTCSLCYQPLGLGLIGLVLVRPGGLEVKDSLIQGSLGLFIHLFPRSDALSELRLGILHVA